MTLELLLVNLQMLSLGTVGVFKDLNLIMEDRKPMIQTRKNLCLSVNDAITVYVTLGPSTGDL